MVKWLVAPQVGSLTNRKLKSGEIVDGSTTRNSREYFAVRCNNHVSTPTRDLSRTKLFKRQISPYLPSDASVIVSKRFCW